MRRLRSLLFITLTGMLLPALVAAQQAATRGTLTGRVVIRGTQTPLPAAQVVIAGTTIGTVTNGDGRFVIPNVVPGSYELRVSLIGYSRGVQPVTVTAGSTATANFELDETAVAIEGLVVTATGAEQRQREIGNSVATVNTANIDMAPVQSVTNLLQGRAAGVIVEPTSGTAGAGSRIRIRGNSSVSLDATPLIIVDGIRVSNESESTALFTGGTSTSRWNDLNPEEIESLEILKGPAASALYGTAAANGVVQITTKRGLGGRTEVRAYAERTGSHVPTDLIPDNVRARGFRTDLNRIDDCSLVERARGVCTSVDSIYRYNPLLDAPGSPLRDGAIDRVGASISGGSSDGAATFYVGGERQSGTGVMTANDLTRTSLRANLSGLVNEKLRVSAQTNFVTGYTQLPQEGNTGSGAFLNAFYGADPSPANVERGNGFRFPYSVSTVGWWKNEEELRRFVGSVTADWRPLTWMHVNGVVGVDQTNRFEQGTIPVPGLVTGLFQEGLREQFRSQNREFTTNLNVNLNRSLRRNVVGTTAIGVQFNQSAGDWTYGAGSGLAPGTLTSGEALSVQEFFGETKLFGVYGSQTMGINDRLFVTAAIRGDQNSAFGQNIGFVVYPALSASWVLLEEPWFPKTPALSTVRVRAAYGESGQRPGRLSAVRTYNTQAVTLDGGVTSGFIVSNAGNPDLTAEISREFEFGFDVGLFNNRVALDVTRYDKTTHDALVARPLPPSVGGPESQFFNLGKVTNKGWESSLQIEALRSDPVNVRLGVKLATNENKLIAIGDSTIPPIAIGLQRHVEGYALGGYWAPRYTYSDANGDGILQFDEVQLAETQDNEDEGLSFFGQPFPKTELSFTADINLFKSLRLSGLLDFKGGHSLWSRSASLRCGDPTGAYCEDRQIPEGASLENQARIIARRNPAVASQAGFVEKADFWKLREVSLTYTVPARFMARTGVARSASISFAGRNLKTWTDYTGLDPETNIPGSVSTQDDPGRFFTVDLFAVPLPRTFVIRVDLGM